MTTVEELHARWAWRPIRNCPGRYVLDLDAPRLPVAALVGADARVHAFVSPRARDEVLVVPLPDGGLISYERRDGTLVHTLNSPEGFARKLADLNLTLDEEDA